MNFKPGLPHRTGYKITTSTTLSPSSTQKWYIPLNSKIPTHFSYSNIPKLHPTDFPEWHIYHSFSINSTFSQNNEKNSAEGSLSQEWFQW
jgi:hypothetical protein